MTSAAKRRIVIAAALFAGAVLTQEGFAQAPPPGVFSEVQTAVVLRQSPALEPATMRSRVVQVDTQKITAARRGREVLKLNLFDDAVVEVQINRVRPTRSGYFISGSPRGKEWGEVRLVVNGPVMVGTVVTPEGEYRIRSAGAGRHLIRQIDPLAVPFECDVEESSSVPPPRPQQAIASIDPLLSSVLPATAQVEDMPTEDGSEIRVLVLYTQAMQQVQGGPVGMRALVDLFVATTNQALEDSGINPRLVLAHSEAVDHVSGGPSFDLYHLRNRFSGYLDEVDALRNEHAADLVHLITNRPTGAAGTASRITSESLSEERKGFAVTATDSETVFAHETGHTLGLAHDRYITPGGSAIYPYAHGYVNKRAFESGAPETAGWITLMAYFDRCANAGLSCPRLLRFANPDQSHLGDPLGVPSDSTETGPDGPADGRLAVNNAAQWVGSFRSRACTSFSVSPETSVVSVDGGEVIVRVESAPGCLWEASGQAEFLQVTSGALYAGTEFVRIQVEPNRTGVERSVELTVAGKSVTVRQFAASEGICGRTSRIVQALTEAAGFGSVTQCDDLTADHLAQINALDLNQQGISALKAGDFAGLSGLTSLMLNNNRLTELPEGLFAGLSSLEELRLDYNQVTELPEGLFADLSASQRLSLDHNQLSELPEGLFAGLWRLKQLHLHYNQLTELPEGLFAGLSSLQELNLGANQLTELPEGLFSGLSDLDRLFLSANSLTTLPENLFAGFSSLSKLSLAHNRLIDVPETLFAGLSNLQNLSLSYNQLTELRPRMFEGLASLNRLDLRSLRLTRLPDGIFAGLTELRQLYLDYNRVWKLPVSVTIARVSDSQFKVVVPTGAPFDLDVPISVSSGGRIENGQGLIMIPAGSVESAAQRVVRETGAEEAVTIDIGELPGQPRSHSGYVLQRDKTLPRWVLPSIASSDAALANLSLSHGSLNPAFSTNVMRYEVQVGFNTSSITITPTPNNLAASFALLDASDSVLADTDATTEGHQVHLSVGVNTIKLRVTSENGEATQTLVILISRAESVCARTPQVRDAIMRSAGVAACGDVTGADLSSITWLNLYRAGISSLKSVDFSGLSSLERLNLNANQLSSLPPNVFSGLNRLREFTLHSNVLASLPEGVFSELVSLETLYLNANELSALPAGVFSELSALRVVVLDDNNLTSLEDDIFSGLTSLVRISLQRNQISSLPAGVFSDLRGLELLSLESNKLDALPPGIFSGLNALRILNLTYNSTDPLPISISLENIGSGEFKAVVPVGAPFDLELPVSVSSDGEIEGSADSVTVSTGELESAAVGVTRLSGTTGAITVDIGTLPTLPANHIGYAFEKDGALPLDVLPEGEGATGICSRTEQVRSALVAAISGVEACADVTESHLSAITTLNLSDEGIASLQSGDFADLTGLTQLVLEDNDLTALPSGLLDGLAALERLNLRGNELSALPAGVFDDLESLSELFLGSNHLRSLPADIFSGLSNLQELWLGDNELTSLPDGVFSGLNALTALILSGNATDPLPISVSLESAGSSEFKAVAAVGAPFALALPVSVSSDGEIEGGAGSVTVLTGAVESAAVGVTRVSGTTGAVTVDIGTLPALPANHSGYALEKDAALPLEVLPEVADATGVCARTEQVRDAIVAAVSGVDACADVTESHLSAIPSLNLSDEGIVSLQSGDFAGITGLAQVVLEGNDLTALPSGLLDGLSALEKLNFKDNDLSALPSGVFDDLGSLSELYLGGNRLSALPADVFSGLSALEILGLADNQLSALGSDDFSGLIALEILYLGGNRLSSLPSDVFSGLSALQELWLGGNQLTSLPDGVFFGLSTLERLNLSGNSTDPLPISVSLENVGSSEFKAVAPVGAPFDLSLPVSASGEGGIEGDADTVTVTTGSLESSAVGVTRAFGTTGGVTVDIGALPALPADHSGYRLERDASLPLAVPAPTESEPVASDDATLSGLSLSSGALDPAFDSQTVSYAASVSDEVSSVTVTPTLSDSNATLAYRGGSDQTLADADSGADGHQVDLEVGANTIKVRVTAEDTTTTQTYTIVVTREDAPVVSGGICDRTEQVRDAIVAAVSGVDECGDVTESHLSAIASLNLSDEGIGSLQSGDFEGLTGLAQLVLEGNDLTALPSGLLDGLSALEKLNFKDNDLSALPSGVFDDLGSLSELYLGGNRLSAVPAEVISGLSTLELLGLADNQLSALGSDDFSGLSSLEILFLGGNRLSSLPSDVFSGLSALQELWLGDNQLTSLPHGVFSGLSALAALNLSGNSTDPLPISVSLENVGSSEFKAVAPVGAPFDLSLPVSASGDGGLEGDADTVTVSTGALESAAVGVTRAFGTKGAVTVDIGTLPALPANHSGYALEKDASLPLAIPSPTESEPVASDDATLRGLSLSDGTLDPAFASGTTSYAATVANSVSSITVTPAPTDTDASLRYLDASEQLKEDADTTADGQQVELDLGENTIKVEVKSADGTTTEIYTLVVTRNRVPSITTASPLSVEENKAVVATLTATDADGDGIVWSTNGGEDESLFNLTESGALTFATAPDYETPSDADEDNAYLVVVRAADGTDAGELTLTVQVTDVEDASSEATLSGLSLSDGSLDPVFASGTTSYTASVSNEGASVTVTPTLSDSDATLAYRDGSDQALADADTGTDGHQVDLEVGENTIKVRVTAEDTTTTQTYTIVVTREDAPVVSGGVCDRTEQVRDAIVAAVSGVDDCADVTESHLSAIPSLNLSDEGIGSLQSGDFEGLTGLAQLVLEGNDLTALPSGLLDGLSALEKLNFKDNDLSALPSGVFDDLGSLSELYLGGNRLSAVPAEVISGLSTLELLGLADNQLSALGSDDFSGLSSLEILFLGGNRLSSLPSDVFSGLSALQELWLGDNQLTSLPHGVFSGLSALAALNLSGNSTDPLPISVSLENVGSSEFKAVAPVGAPFDLSLPVSASGDGGLEGDADTVTVSTGALESAAVGVTRAFGTKGAVTVDIGTLPALPANHSGYALEKDASLPLAIPSPTESEPVAGDDATLSGLSLSSGALSPVFSADIRSYAATVANSVSSITVAPTKSDTDATVAYLDAIDNDLTDADGSTAGHQVGLSVGDNTIKVTVTAEDTTTTLTYVLVVTRNSVPEITTTSPILVDENQTAVALLAATDADGDGISWSRNGGADEAQFNLTTDGELTFVSAPDYESPADTGANNQYVVVVRASDGIDHADLTLTTTVADLDEGARDDATLVGLTLGLDDTMEPAFASEKTSYRARIQNEVSSITVTPTKSNVNATVTYFDATDKELVDADTTMDGHQVDLIVGNSTIKVKVTAEDGVATRTYTIVVKRYGEFTSEPIIVTASPISVQENQTKVATLEATDRDDDIVLWSTIGGADEDLFNLTTEGVLTFLSAPSFEAPADADQNNQYVVIVEATDDWTGTSVLTLTVIVTDLDEGEPTSDDATLSGLSLSSGALDPAFDSQTVSYAASVSDEVSSVTVTPTLSDSNATLAYRGGSDQTLADADSGADGHQVDLEVGANTIKVRVTAEDTTTTRTYTIVVTREDAPVVSGGICDRTEQVRDAIVAAVSGVDECGDVTESHLSAIPSLNLSDEGIGSLQSGDFEGLTGLAQLVLEGNDLTALPSGLLDGLSALEKLNFKDNDLSALPSGVFDDLGSLSALYLGGNRLSAVPAEVISGMSTLEILGLADNQLSALESDDFSGLSSLEVLFLGGNRLSSLPADVFSGLSALQELWLGGNSTDPLPLTVSLKKVEESQFKAVMLVGAPFVLALPVSVSSAGEIEGGAGSVMVSTGAVESAAVGVTRVSGTTGAVTVDIGMLPSLPARHVGYVLQKDDSLPLTILPAQSGAPAESVAANASYADVNRDGVVEADDAMLIYHAFESAGPLGDGETGGTAQSRKMLLSGLAGVPDPNDDELRAMLGKANQWREVGLEVGGDINGDGLIDGSDALAMYYAFEFENLVGNGETGGTTRFRRSLLAEHAAQANAGDADLKAMLRNAHALRAAAAEAAQ